MVRNGNEKKNLSNNKFYIGNPIRYEMVMVQNGFSHGTKWTWYETTSYPKQTSSLSHKYVTCTRHNMDEKKFSWG
jgi:hypothetical protein